MADLSAFSPILFFLTPFFIAIAIKFFFTATKQPAKATPYLTNTFPIIGSYLALRRHVDDRLPWMTEQLRVSPTSTVVIQKPLFRGQHIVTANPANVEHILKAKFVNYPKGQYFTSVLGDLLGHGIFNADGEQWKYQRQVASHEFSTKSLRKFVEQVVDAELNNRLIPLASESAETGKVFDLQDLLRRFAFDNICKIAFGYDPELLLPSLPESAFADAFEDGVAISSERFRTVAPIIWRIKRFLNIGSEKRLGLAVSRVRDLASKIVKKKMEESSPESDSDLDLLSRFLKSGHSDERFVTDIVISFILAGRDTTSAAMTWFFWLLSKNPAAEAEIVSEINRSEENPRVSAYERTKELMYTHAAVFESMRLFPPVLIDTKQLAGGDDVWPDGTAVRNGTTMSYHVYAMGRMGRIWGEDWAEFRPERWLEEREEGEVRRKVFIGKDPYSYPVFQAGPRVCLGKDMAVLQMKVVVAGILRRFRVVPVAAEGFEPVLLPYLTGKMKDGFPVRFERRAAP